MEWGWGAREETISTRFWLSSALLRGAQEEDDFGSWGTKMK